MQPVTAGTRCGRVGKAHPECELLEVDAGPQRREIGEPAAPERRALVAHPGSTPWLHTAVLWRGARLWGLGVDRQPTAERAAPVRPDQRRGPPGVRCPTLGRHRDPPQVPGRRQLTGSPGCAAARERSTERLRDLVSSASALGSGGAVTLTSSSHSAGSRASAPRSCAEAVSRLLLSDLNSTITWGTQWGAARQSDLIRPAGRQQSRRTGSAANPGQGHIWNNLRTSVRAWQW